MSFFQKFFAADSESMVLIDVSSASVAGAYAHFKRGEQPMILYTKRIPIRARSGEPTAEEMEHTLIELVDVLVAEGGPAHARVVGHSRIASILVSVSAPWQETSIRTETVEQPHPFTFTKATLQEVERKFSHVPDHKVLSGQSIIATLLNGYEVRNPFGKRVERADLLVLSSILDASVAEVVTNVLRKKYHTHAIRLTAFAPLAYAVFRDVYPHERDYLILNVGGETSDLTLVKRGLLTSVTSTPHGLADMLRAAEHAPLSSGSAIDPVHDPKISARVAAAKADWVKSVTEGLSVIGSGQALPRTLFLLTEEAARDFMKELLDEGPFRSLLLSDEPLAIIPVVPEHFAPFVKTRGDAEGDVVLELMALFHNKEPLE